MLKQAIETLGGDPLISLYYFGTCIGLVSLLKLLKQFRQFLRRIFRRKLAIDLSSSSAAVFDAVKD